MSKGTAISPLLLTLKRLTALSDWNKCLHDFFLNRNKKVIFVVKSVYLNCFLKEKSNLNCYLNCGHCCSHIFQVPYFSCPKKEDWLGLGLDSKNTFHMFKIISWALLTLSLKSLDYSVLLLRFCQYDQGDHFLNRPTKYHESLQYQKSGYYQQLVNWK